MDTRSTFNSAFGSGASSVADAEAGIDFDWFLGIAKRQWKIFVASVIAFIAIGLVFVMTAMPLYKAGASVLIDRANSEIVEQLSNIGGVIDDDASVLSQVELLKSRTILLRTVDMLKLDSDPVFMAADRGIISSTRAFLRSLLDVSQWFVSREVTAEDLEKRRLAAADRLRGNMEISRVGKTYVLSVEFTSPSAELSARVVNGIAEAYLVDKLDAKYEATRRASSWLQDRIAELRQSALESDLAVQKFRTANGLVSTGTQLVSDQQLAELNSALISAQADVATKTARYNRIQQIISDGQMDAIVTDVLASSISNDLRGKYLAAAKRADELTAMLGARHESVLKQKNEMNDYKRQMFEELGRIAESYKSDVDVAQAREETLRRAVMDATDVSAVANETKVQLRELEREAETYRNLYQSFLQKFQEAAQQQSFPVTEARVISSAVVPTVPAYPRKTLVLALFTILGGAVGSGLGMFREYRDRFFRTGEQIRRELGLEMLGLAPKLPVSASTNESDAVAVDHLPVHHVRRSGGVSNYVLDHPMSSFAETMRSIKFAADLALPNTRCKIIGVVSTIPGEGKSTVAMNFAELLASHGAKTILIDADLRNPGATRAMGQHADKGLVEVLVEKQPLQDVLLINSRSGLAFLPAVMKRRLPHSSELLASAAMRNLLEKISATADYVVVDLPPLAPVVDARAMASNVDAFVYVTEWGRVSRRMVRQTLEAEPQVLEKCLGVVLNKVDLDRMRLYRVYGTSDYYYSSYSKYYRED